MDNPDEMICTIIGEAVKHVVFTARDRGILNKLPKAANCELGVENLEGYYGWPSYEERGKENVA